MHDSDHAPPAGLVFICMQAVITPSIEFCMVKNGRGVLPSVHGRRGPCRPAFDFRFYVECKRRKDWNKNCFQLISHYDTHINVCVSLGEDVLAPF